MRIPPDILKCVSFVGIPATDPVTRGTKVRYVATAFFVSMPSAVATAQFVYIVTARHVPAQIGNRLAVLRLNKKGGGADFLSMPPGLRWTVHPTDASADVAVVGFAPNAETFDYLNIPESLFLMPNAESFKTVGVGDEVFITGLFAHLSGNTRNLPIVRMGNIAMMPDEGIPTAMGTTDAYLIESRSIGGLSGSPAFVRTGSIIERKTYLLGLVHGHWDIPPAAKNDIADIAPTGTRNEVNMGIAIVTPSYKIRETLDHPELATLRQSENERLLAEAAKAAAPAPPNAEAAAATAPTPPKDPPQPPTPG